jgi:hypothetical protein
MASLSTGEFKIGTRPLENFVLLPDSVQYKFLRRCIRPPVLSYTTNPDAKFVYLNPNLITRVTLNVGVFNNGKTDSDIHIVEFSESSGRVATFAIDDIGLEILGGKNPNSEGEVAV